MEVNRPSEVVATHNGYNLISVLDDGKGKVVFDVCFQRCWDPDSSHGRDWIWIGDTPQYVRNIADWLMNQPPNKPSKPLGKTSGKVGVQYSYVTVATDPDDDQLLYMWDWGDGNDSGWLETAEATHTWTTEDIFEIKVKVKDEKGGESYWSDTFVFSTPKNKIINKPIIRFLDQHPHLFPLLRQLLSL
jgi:hypothetical protein